MSVVLSAPFECGDERWALGTRRRLALRETIAHSDLACTSSEYKLWTDADSRKFLVEHYNWFVPIFDAYPYPIQRADAIRYFVLYHYGGIYMDLDIGCLRRLDPLLRFEIILPKTIPVGVSNDVMFAAKQHPFMDQVIHNLVTFNHQYLSNYPTVMFSTGPMFVSASYGLYVDAHGPAMPSTPMKPAAGFKGVRVLPKPLYGKNAKPAEAPDAFFSHYYGSSWHANDAGFLIFLRDHGRFLMFVGACIVAYGALRTMAPRLLHMIGERGGIVSPRRGGRWIRLAVRGTDPQPSSRRHRSRHRSLDRNGENRDHVAGSTSISMPAPRPQRLSLPLFQLQEQESTREPQSVLAYLGSSLSRPSSRGDGLSEAESSSSGVTGKKKGGVLYLSAYFVGRGDDGASQQLSPSSSSSSTPASTWNPAHAASGGSLGGWASSLLPTSWRGPSPSPAQYERAASNEAEAYDLESVPSASADDDAPDAAGPSGRDPVPSGRFARSWTDGRSKSKRTISNESASTDASSMGDGVPEEFAIKSLRVRSGSTAAAADPSSSSIPSGSRPVGLLRRTTSASSLRADSVPITLPTGPTPPPPYSLDTSAANKDRWGSGEKTPTMSTVRQSMSAGRMACSPGMGPGVPSRTGERSRSISQRSSLNSLRTQSRRHGGGESVDAGLSRRASAGLLRGSGAGALRSQVSATPKWSVPADDASSGGDAADVEESSSQEAEEGDNSVEADGEAEVAEHEREQVPAVEEEVDYMLCEMTPRIVPGQGGDRQAG